MTEGFSIEALNSAHNRKGFSSGVEPLDRYFRELVTQDVKRRVSNCFVALDAAARAARAEPAIFALIVDAKDDSAVAFYQRHEFRRFVSKPASLFLPIATALQACLPNAPSKRSLENIGLDCMTNQSESNGLSLARTSSSTLAGALHMRRFAIDRFGQRR